MSKHVALQHLLIVTIKKYYSTVAFLSMQLEGSDPGLHEPFLIERLKCYLNSKDSKFRSRPTFGGQSF